MHHCNPWTIFISQLKLRTFEGYFKRASGPEMIHDCLVLVHMVHHCLTLVLKTSPRSNTYVTQNVLS